MSFWHVGFDLVAHCVFPMPFCEVARVRLGWHAFLRGCSGLSGVATHVFLAGCLGSLGWRLLGLVEGGSTCLFGSSRFAWVATRVFPVPFCEVAWVCLGWQPVSFWQVAGGSLGFAWLATRSFPCLCGVWLGSLWGGNPCLFEKLLWFAWAATGAFPFAFLEGGLSLFGWQPVSFWQVAWVRLGGNPCFSRAFL